MPNVFTCFLCLRIFWGKIQVVYGFSLFKLGFLWFSCVGFMLFSQVLSGFSCSSFNDKKIGKTHEDRAGLGV